jgi:DNA/RNA endonuclease YhcR with UshA esterase domain
MLPGKIVSIAGPIELYQGKPEINIVRADQIKVLDTQTERGAISL